MDNHEAVSRWLSTHAFQELANGDFAQIDIDDLLEESPTDAVRVGLQCLSLALEEARATHPFIDGILVVPLPASDSLDTEAPALTTYVDRSWTYRPGTEVVGLYLARPRLWRGYEAVEDYRRHLPGQDLLPSGYVAYYRSWRTEAAASSGWEYNRAIYIRTI